jgi:hypothetical protein
MSEKRANATKKGGRAKAADQSVLGSLPSTRPTRLARRRDGEAPAATGGATATVAPPRAAAARAKPAAKPRPAAAKPQPAAAKPQPAAAKPRPAAAKPRPAATRSGPEAVSASSPSLTPPRQGRAVPPPPQEPERRSGPPTGIDLVTTAVQAAGEVAQIGLTVGGQILKRAVGRVPRR